MLEIAGSAVVILTGDFNAMPADEPMEVITNHKNPLHLTDTRGSRITDQQELLMASGRRK